MVAASQETVTIMIRVVPLGVFALPLMLGQSPVDAAEGKVARFDADVLGLRSRRLRAVT